MKRQIETKMNLKRKKPDGSFEESFTPFTADCSVMAAWNKLNEINNLPSNYFMFVIVI